MPYVIGVYVLSLICCRWLIGLVFLLVAYSVCYSWLSVYYDLFGFGCGWFADVFLTFWIVGMVLWLSLLAVGVAQLMVVLCGICCV